METPAPEPPNDRDREVVQALRRIIRAVDLHSRRLEESFGLTAPQLAALQEAQRFGPLSPGELARRIHLSAGTVTGILDRLERRALVHRVPDPADRRRLEIEVTHEGREVLLRAPALLQDRLRQALGGLQDWEQTLLLSALQRIASMMDASELSASPHLTLTDPAASAPPHETPDQRANP
ncbi:MAG TPA: MarR family transcriptional regulator [Planctomycetota bacterium]|nr:MarR family transcriptional regulator [Planctomycetota bacterium]